MSIKYEVILLHPRASGGWIELTKRELLKWQFDDRLAAGEWMIKGTDIERIISFSYANQFAIDRTVNAKINQLER